MQPRTTSRLVSVLVLSLVASAIPASAGDVIDRIVARVNGRTIFMSDWDEELCFEALLDVRPPTQFNPEQRRGALDRLIDQELLRQQLRLTQTLPADMETIRKKISEIRAAHAGAETDDGWKSLLARYGLTEAEVSRRVASQMNLMQSVDARLRPGVQIDSASVEAYYHDKFAPSAQADAPAALPEVAGKIKEVLIEQKVNDLLTAWLQTLRTEGEIRTTAPSPSSSPGEAR
jgi:hypothetical protein